MYLLAQTLFLAVAAGRTGRATLAALAGASAAVCLLVRFDLAPLLLTAAFLLHVVAFDRPERRQRLAIVFFGSWSALSVVVGGVAGLMAHEVVEAFSLNPAYLLHSAFAKPAGSAEFGQGPVGAGGWDFMSHDPVLVLGAIIAVLIGL